MKKEALSVYLDPDVMAQLSELASQKNQPKSLIAEAAIGSFVTPDESDRCEAALVRRLDLLSRQGERLERDLSIVAEVIALFVKFWLTVTPPLPEGAQAAAQAKGRERFELFLDRRDCPFGGERNELVALARQKRIGRDDECTASGPAQVFEDGIEMAIAARVAGMQL
jgi:hypothetical protein